MFKKNQLSIKYEAQKKNGFQKKMKRAPKNMQII